MEIVKILIVEDDIGFAYLVQHQLTNLGFQSQFILTVHTLEDARLAHLEFEIDVILLDLNLKESQGIETFNEINSIFPSASIIVLTGLDEKALALNIVAKGAQDYLLKTNLSSQVLEKTINYGMLRRKVRVELSKSEKKYKDDIENTKLQNDKLKVIKKFSSPYSFEWNEINLNSDSTYDDDMQEKRDRWIETLEKDIYVDEAMNLLKDLSSFNGNDILSQTNQERILID